jgi:hypothetical protein
LGRRTLFTEQRFWPNSIFGESSHYQRRDLSVAKELILRNFYMCEISACRAADRLRGAANVTPFDFKGFSHKNCHRPRRTSAVSIFGKDESRQR